MVSPGAGSLTLELALVSVLAWNCPSSWRYDNPLARSPSQQSLLKGSQEQELVKRTRATHANDTLRKNMGSILSRGRTNFFWGRIHS